MRSRSCLIPVPFFFFLYIHGTFSRSVCSLFVLSGGLLEYLPDVNRSFLLFQVEVIANRNQRKTGFRHPLATKLSTFPKLSRFRISREVVCHLAKLLMAIIDRMRMRHRLLAKELRSITVLSLRISSLQILILQRCHLGVNSSTNS